jgi:hypothetical protein
MPPEMFGKVLQRGPGLGLLFTIEVDTLFRKKVFYHDEDLKRFLRLTLGGQFKAAGIIRIESCLGDQVSPPGQHQQFTFFNCKLSAVYLRQEVLPRSPVHWQVQ